MSSDTNVSGLFASALGTEPAKPAAKSSCCGPKPEAAKEETAPKASSCCGPKPAATDATAAPADAAPKAKSSCCG